MGGGSLDAKGNGLHSQSIIVYNSSADNRPSFLQVTTVSDGEKKADGRFTAKNISLGMVPFRFEASEQKSLFGLRIPNLHIEQKRNPLALHHLALFGEVAVSELIHVTGGLVLF